jgi:DNA-binding response OmpR family regulator
MEGEKAATRVATEQLSSAEWVRPDAAVLQGRAVLVLDDEESLRSLLQEGLAAHGLQVDTAASAEEALALILGRSYDVLLCDLKLSGSGANSDGTQVAERLLLAAGDAKPTTIFMTGDFVDTAEAKPGKPRRLQKPFRISEVLAVMREIIEVSPASTKK